MFRGLFNFITDSYTNSLIDNEFLKKVIVKSNCFFDKYWTYKKVLKESTKLNTSISILGISNSGKTSYLTALFYRMLASRNGYLLVGKDAFTSENLLNNVNNLRNSSLKEDRFSPNNKKDITKYSFDLLYNFDDIVMSLDLYDYSGSVLSSKKTRNMEDYKKFKDTINKSNSILLFIDSSFFVGGDNEEKVDNIKFECASIFNSFIRDYIESGNKILPVSIVVTKYDLLNKSISDEDLCKIIKESFDPLFDKKTNRLDRIVSIIPISLGEKISEKDYAGELKPVNIYLPFFFSLYFALDKNDKFQNYHREKLKLELKNIPYLYKNGKNFSFKDIK